MSSSHPSTRRPSALDALVGGAVDLVAALARGATLVGRAVMFWAAVLLAPCALAMVALGLGDLPVVTGLVAANVLALVGGHGHRREAVASE